MSVLQSVVVVWCVVVLALTTTSVMSSPATGSLSTNEVYDDAGGPGEPAGILPQCSRGAICAMVEVNSFGLSSIPLCTCPGGGPSCPIVWDQEDGRSVTVGPKQYKYCLKPGPLHVCGRGEKAYVSAFHFQPATFQIASASHRLLCYCPPATRYLAPAGTEETFEDGLMVIASVHTCSQLPICSPKMACKEVSVAETGSLVEIKCRCPRPLNCPTLSQEMVPHENNYIKGAGYSVYCQLFF